MDFLILLLIILVSALLIVLCAFIIIGEAINFMCAILFVYHAFFKKTKYFSTAFFYILSIGYAFDIVTFILMFLSSFCGDTVIGIGDVLFYYSVLLLGPWNTLMALNRFTAIWFWKEHDWYWRNRIIIFAMAGMFGYPILVSFPILVQNPYCFFHSLNESCVEVLQTATLTSTISNGVHVIIAAALGIITSLASRFNIIAVTPETNKLQQFLLIQSILSLFFYGCHLFYTSNGTTPDNPVLESILGTLSETYYVFFRLSSTMLLLLLSKTVRESFCSFYKFLSCCCCCCCCCKKESKEKRRKPLAVEITKSVVKVV